MVPSVFAIEIDQPKAVETIHHVLPEETPTIETSEPQKYDDLYFYLLFSFILNFQKYSHNACAIIIV